MDAFFYYADLISQTYVLQNENLPVAPQKESSKVSLLTRLDGWLTKWFTPPVKAEQAEAYYQAVTLTYWGGY